jgi:hypothetical protein
LCVQPFESGKVDDCVADCGEETAVEAGVVAPKTGVWMDGEKSCESLGEEYCNNTPVYYFDILRGFSSKYGVVACLEGVDDPGSCDYERTREQENKLGELEEFVVDSREGEGDQDGQEVEGGGDDFLHEKSIAVYARFGLEYRLTKTTINFW